MILFESVRLSLCKSDWNRGRLGRLNLLVQSNSESQVMLYFQLTFFCFAIWWSLKKIRNCRWNYLFIRPSWLARICFCLAIPRASTELILDLFKTNFNFYFLVGKKKELLTFVIVFVVVSPNSIRHFEIDIDGLRLSLGPSVVEIFFYSRYRCDEVDANVGIGYPIALVVDISISIESLFHRPTQNLNRCRCKIN